MKLKKTLLVAAVLLAADAFAKFKAEDIRVDGRLEFGVKDGFVESADEIYEFEIDIETKRKNGNKLELEFESNSEDNELRMTQGFVDRELVSENRVRFGKGKKIVGFEYENSKTKRLGISRSLIYQYMENFSFVGYDFFGNYQWRQRLDENKTTKVASLSLHSNQSEDVGLIYSRNFTPASEWKTMSWLLLQADKARRDYQMVGILMFGVEKREGDDQEVFSFELFYGKDPLQSEFERDYDNSEQVFFAGLKAEYGIRMEDLFPYTQLTYIAQRLDEPGYDLTQALLGLRYYLDEDLRIAFEFDGLQSSRRTDPWKKNWDESELKVELMYVF